MNKLPIYDNNIIEDGDNVPSEAGDLYISWEKEKYGNSLSENKPAPPPPARFNHQDFKRNKEFFLTDREKESREDEFLMKHGINF